MELLRIAIVMLFLCVSPVLVSAGEPESLSKDEYAALTNVVLVYQNAQLALENAELKRTAVITRLRSQHKMSDADTWDDKGVIARKPLPVATPKKENKK